MSDEIKPVDLSPAKPERIDDWTDGKATFAFDLWRYADALIQAAMARVPCAIEGRIVRIISGRSRHVGSVAVIDIVVQECAE